MNINRFFNEAPESEASATKLILKSTRKAYRKLHDFAKKERLIRHKWCSRCQNGPVGLPLQSRRLQDFWSLILNRRIDAKQRSIHAEKQIVDVKEPSIDAKEQSQSASVDGSDPENLPSWRELAIQQRLEIWMWLGYDLMGAAMMLQRSFSYGFSDSEWRVTRTWSSY